MELKKLVEVIKKKFKQELKTHVRVLVGGSYALKQVYGLLERPINDIDIIIVPHWSYYDRPVFKGENQAIARNKWIAEKSEEADRILSELIFPTEDVHDCCMDYGGSEEPSCWIVNSKIETIVGYAKTNLNFLLSCNFSADDYNSSITHEGIPVVPLAALLRAKGGYNRAKDQIDFFNIGKKLSSHCKGSNYTWEL